MILKDAIAPVLDDLEASLLQLEPSQYAQELPCLFGQSIGQHVRHIIELFQCLEQGYDSGTINYDRRVRNRTLETIRDTAVESLRRIFRFCEKPDKPLFLEASFHREKEDPMIIASSYYRELAYNLEHAIHHMAMIRIGLRELGSVRVADSFGVASSTLKYRKACAQ